MRLDSVSRRIRSKSVSDSLGEQTAGEAGNLADITTVERSTDDESLVPEMM